MLSASNGFYLGAAVPEYGRLGEGQDESTLKLPEKVEARMRPKPRLILAFFLFAALQRQLNQRDFGGGVWKSNPPFGSQRAESPALKAGKVTGPLSPPLL
jgi:hypothetical protein